MTKPVSRSELSRLGKRGSYRLGLLAPQGMRRPAPPRPFTPSFSRSAHAGPAWAWIVAALGGAGLIAVGARAGLWFLPMLAGVITGIAVRRGEWRLSTTVLFVMAMCALGWGAALAGLALGGLPAGAAAKTIAGVAGLPAYAAVGVVVTLAVAVLQGLAGLWLGRAITPAD
ncbi:MAG TPA: hypothetical protein VFQ44_03925 [Streptosporangiaceae bacterium]|nr:hypothetical protein [Streptosporangiaceae bacterium]